MNPTSPQTAALPTITYETVRDALKRAVDAAARKSGQYASTDLVAAELFSILTGAEPPAVGIAAAAGVPDPVGEALRACQGAPIRAVATVRHMHARLFHLEGGATPVAAKDALGDAYLRASLDVLCWVLRHDEHNPTFAVNMGRLAQAMRHAGNHPLFAGPASVGQAAALRDAGERYAIVRVPGRPNGIQCLACLRVSHHPDDVANLFCGHCRVFHDEGLDQDLAALEARSIAADAARDGHGDHDAAEGGQGQ